MKALFSAMFMAFAINGYAQSFVSKGKCWHVLEISENAIVSNVTFKGVTNVYDITIGEESDTIIDGVAYVRMTKGKDVCAVVREEGGRVYGYSEALKKECLIYDFTLNTGDTFLLESMREDGGAFHCTVNEVTYEDHGGRELKCIGFTSIYHDANGVVYPAIQNTWREEFGGKEPFCQPQMVECPGAVQTIVPYVTISDVCFLPASFNILAFNGQQLVLGDDVTYLTSNDQWEHDDLHYEFSDSQTLHVYGTMWTSCSPNQYIYCSTNNYDVRLDIEELAPYAKCIGAHVVDMYFPGFFADGTYYIYDSEGKHAVHHNVASVPISHKVESESSIYGLDGRILNKRPAKGIYIERNVKKVAK